MGQININKNMESNLKEYIKKVRSSIVAIGFEPAPNQITILGSGFIHQGKIITCAHLLNNLSQEQIDKLKASVMFEPEKGPEIYNWMSIKLVPDKKDMNNDLAIFEFLDQKPQNTEGLVLGDSENIEIGQNVYFIGFPYATQLINDGFGMTLVANKGMISNIKPDAEFKKVWFIVDGISNPGNSGCPVINAETNEVIGVMSISFRTASQTVKELDIREPMHIAGAKPINLVKPLLK
jgi:S1-C subfamily serine protease